MHFSTPIAALSLLLASSFAAADWPASGAGGWGSDNAWAATTALVTTTYIAETTVTMTLLQVQTETMHYYSAKNSTVAASSTYNMPSPSALNPVDVSATPSVCENCNVSTGSGSAHGANLAVAAMAGLGALFWASL